MDVSLSGEEKTVWAGLGRHLRSRLVSGVLVLIPLAVTLFVLRLVFSALISFALPVVQPLLKDAPPIVLLSIALLVMIVLIYVVGQITTHIVGRRMIKWGESVLLKLPLIKSVYAASKQMVDTFSTSTTAAFQAVVLVAFPHRESMAVGFVTGTILDQDNRLLYRVFVPTTPNPTSGFLVMLAEREVSFTDISIEEGVKMIVSGGMLAPAQYKLVAPHLGGTAAVVANSAV